MVAGGMSVTQTSIRLRDVVGVIAAVGTAAFVAAQSTLAGGPLWKLALFVTLTVSVVLIALGLSGQALLAVKDRVITRWWDPAAVQDGDFTWAEVWRLTCGPLADDPLRAGGSARSGSASGEMLGLAMGGVAGLGIVLVCAAALFALVTPGDIALPAASPSADLSKTALPALLALLAALLTITFTYYQLRAKVRADNRQVWIARLRVLIAEVTAMAYALDGANRTKTVEIWQKLGSARLEFELMLNPSEKDHRVLMYLVQQLSDLSTPIHGYIADAHNLRTIVLADTGDDEKWQRLLDCRKAEQLVGYIMRLAHVVLKREWERVKRAR